MTATSGSPETSARTGPMCSGPALGDQDPGRRGGSGTASVTLSGYRSGSPQPHVLRTNDSGANWHDLSGNLPTAPVNDVLAAGGNLYAATDQGVFVSSPSAISWSRLGSGLPLVPVTGLAYDGGHQRLVISTFGRGFYQTTVG